jgi:hypothetical protein
MHPHRCRNLLNIVLKLQNIVEIDTENTLPSDTTTAYEGDGALQDMQKIVHERELRDKETVALKMQ